MRTLLACLLVLFSLPAGADEARRVYVWGNSLVHHPEEPRTNVPYWLGRMAEAGGKTLALDGQWAFLRDWPGADMAPNWSVTGVDKAGSDDPDDYDTIVLTPTNFIQWQAPDRPYAGSEATPLGITLGMIDRMAAAGTEVLIYEGWADLGDYGFPPRARALRRYHAFNRGDYHDWYVAYRDALRAARPDVPIDLIPVAPILAEVMTGPLSALGPEAFYLDDAPHGTEETYFLAAAITYAALWREAPPEALTLPASLHADLVQAWPEIRALIWARVQEMAPERMAARRKAASADMQTETAEAAPGDVSLPPRREIALPPRGARPDGAPALAMGLNGISDWSTQHPFIDVMKTARPWIGHLPGQWGGMSHEDLQGGGHLDARGWPVSLPQTAEKLETFILTDQPEAAEHLRGAYVLRYGGSGAIELSGRAQRVQYRDGEIRFHYTPGDGPVGIVIRQTEVDDPIRDITVVKEDLLELHAVGALFNPVWLERIADLRVLRFMDWMATNGSPVEAWEDRPRLEDATWAARGVPLPVMIALANRIGADPWFTLPHKADDDYVRRFAAAVKTGLDPRRKAYVEYSNEVWNRIFPQADWAAQQAQARWGESAFGWMQAYGLRAAEVMDLVADVYGDAAEDRLVRVVSTQTGWPGLEEHVLTAPLAFLALGRPPSESFDAYAVTGYFGYETTEPNMVARMERWLDASEAQARAAGEAEGLRRVALREYVRAHRFEGAYAAMEAAIRNGSLRTLTQELFPYHFGAAERAGLDLIMYEGGTHAALAPDAVDNERLAAFLSEFSYTPEMASLYREALEGWLAAGGRLFNAFVDVAPPSKWGSWGALRHLDDANPRWDMLMAHNASAPVDWEERAADAFAGGVTRIAGGTAERIEGTPWDDVMIGGGGADTMVSGGGSDRLHGGAGQDRAVLPGARAEYRFYEDGPRLVAVRGRDAVTLLDVEEMVFADTPGDVVPTN